MLTIVNVKESMLFVYTFELMNSKTNRYILLFITITIIATIVLQIHWNIKNYNENKTRLTNEVQIAFDNSVEKYYAENAKKNVITMANRIPITSNTKKEAKIYYTQSMSNSTSVHSEMNASLQKKDSGKNNIVMRLKTDPAHAVNVSTIKIIKKKKNSESKIDLKNLINTIVVSMVEDSLDLKKLSTYFVSELARKELSIDYKIDLIRDKAVSNTFPKNNQQSFPLTTFSTSSYIPPQQELKLSFNDSTLLVLQRSMIEIILSLFLSLSIIGCLLYLLKIINRQKKADEIKNDLISNITHEFKTPITTISSAIEGIRNFNAINDAEKTKRYLDISSQQLGKLENMVEKLLETATLETDQLLIHKESINIIPLLKNNIEKYKFIAPDKTISFQSNMEQLPLKVDRFHFDNAVSNLIDNAVKYGGYHIFVTLEYENGEAKICIEDNGVGIEKSQQSKIFDKFYRIPKGNIHDVKGFGIGLYYAKKIIEKHGGALELVISNTTIFKITLYDV